MEDIIIFSKDADSHLRHVEQIVSELHKESVTINLGRFAFFKKKVGYLGHLFELGKLSIKEIVTKALKEAETPRGTQAFRSFLGLCKLFMRFSPIYTKIIAPLNRLLKADSPENIDPQDTEQKTSFCRLIEEVTSPPVLAVRLRRYIIFF